MIYQFIYVLFLYFNNFNFIIDKIIIFSLNENVDHYF